MRSTSLWAVLLLGVVTIHRAHAADHLRLGTNWRAEADHGGYYQAQATGLYKARGLDVSIIEGGAQINNIQLLMAGQLDLALVSSSMTALNLAQKHLPFVAVAAFLQRDPGMLMVHPECGITSLREIRGHTLFLSPEARRPLFAYLQQRYQVREENMRPYMGSIVPFLIDKTSVQSGYITNEPYFAERAGVHPKTFLLSSEGFSSYAGILIASRDLVARHPEQIRRFIEASAQGWHDFLHGDHRAALALIRADNPEYSQDEAEHAIQTINSEGLVESGDALTGGIGAMTDARWAGFYSIMEKAGVYPPGMPYRDAYTTRFVGPDPRR